MKLKLSNWHDWHVKPVRVGWYQRIINSDIFFSFWNGMFWCLGSSPTLSYAECYVFKTAESLYSKFRWRGIVKDKK